ncbi:MAG TPA: TonB-dependent receptor [Vicinamibacterales bacterium]|nr:TonB-dependent receptor [Vicinamibacterales bacterium]
MKHYAWLIGVLALCLSATTGAYAQEQSASIQGVVADTSGAVLPGVTIEARSPSVVGVSTTTSDERGIYRFPALPPGRYELTASLSGFATKKLSDVDLLLGQALKIDLQLALASVSESVQVTGESPIIDVKQNAATASITQDLMERIPRGRNFTTILNTAPGTNDESRNGGNQIDGSSGSENRFVVDGMDTTNLRTGVSGKTVFTDFLAEVQVKSSGYAAEYGGSTGGVVNAISKSGSNSFRGSGGAYYRNEKMQSAPRKGWRINPFTDCTANTCSGTPEFVATPDAPFTNWNPIGDLGGPIFQNRAWFYGGISYDRTDTERRTTFRNSPAPYVTKTLSTWSDSKYYNGNISTQPTNNTRLRFSTALTRSANRGTFTNLNVQPDGSFFADGTPTNGFNTATWDATEERFKDRWERTGSNSRNDLYVGDFNWTMTSRLLLNVNSGYWATDTWSPEAFAGDQIIHSFNGTNCDPLGGTCPFPETPESLRRIQGFSDNKSTSRTVQDLYARTHVNTNLTWFKSGWGGEHQFKLGARVERLQNRVNSGAQQPTITLFWNQAYAALDGRTVRGPYGYYQVSRGVVTNGEVNSNNWGFWVQDSWTVRRNLTINAGLRTENENTPSFRNEFPGISFGFAEKLAPRVGFAYDIKGDSRWKAYGSYGRYFDVTKLEMPRGSFGAEHWIQYFWTLDTLDWTGINCQEGPTGCPGTYIEQNDRRHPANEPDPKLAAYFGREQNTIDPDIKPVRTGEITLGLDHELNRTMSVGVRYVHKWLDRTIEDVGILVPGVGEVFFIANPGEGVAEQILPKPAPVLPAAQRDYDGVEFRLTRRLANRWSMIGSYTWSRLFGNYGGLASSDENGRTSPNVERYFDGMYLLFDKTGTPVYGLLPTDRPHYFKLQATYDLPWGTNVGMLGYLASGGPLSTAVNLLGYNPTFVNGRGDLGRLPWNSQIDLFLQHDFRLMRGHRVAVNLNIDNLFDQAAVLNQNTSPYRDSMSVPSSIASSTTTPGVLSARDNYLLNTGYDPAFLAAAMRTAGSRMRDNSLYGKPSSFQGRRQLRLGFKYTF